MWLDYIKSFFFFKGMVSVSEGSLSFSSQGFWLHCPLLSTC